MKTLMKTLDLGWKSLSLALVIAAWAPTIQAQDAPKLNDAEIAHVGVTANQIDVNYAKIAEEKSQNKDIVNFAKTMARDHTSVIEQASALAGKLGVTPQDNDMSKSLIEGYEKTAKDLRSKNGKAFDKAYIDNEVAYHKAVIGAVKTVLIPQTQNAELKSFLEKIMPTLEAHLRHAEKVQSEFK